MYASVLCLSRVRKAGIRASVVQRKSCLCNNGIHHGDLIAVQELGGGPRDMTRCDGRAFCSKNQSRKNLSPVGTETKAPGLQPLMLQYDNLNHMIFVVV